MRRASERSPGPSGARHTAGPPGGRRPVTDRTQELVGVILKEMTAVTVEPDSGRIRGIPRGHAVGTPECVE